MRAWLSDRQSLTVKLMAHSQTFRVRRLSQRSALCLVDETQALGLPRRLRVQEREVVLLCDGVPMVYAHTVVPMRANAHDWPFFGGLGERSLGTTLFGDPLVSRGVLHYARLRAGHPLAQRAAGAIGQSAACWHARRCLFARKNGLLLVTEVFSPSILGLARAERRQFEPTWASTGGLAA